MVRRRLTTSRRRPTPWGPAARTRRRRHELYQDRDAVRDLRPTGFGRAPQGNERQRAMNRVMALNHVRAG